MQRKMLVAIGASGVVSVALAVVVNVATDTAPRWIVAIRPWAWVLVIALGLAAIVLAAWQRRLDAPKSPAGSSSQPGCGGPREIPRDISEFTGRDNELARLNALARKGGIAAIAGKPGVGKSALVVHAAHLLSERYPDGQIFLDLQGMGGTPLPVQAGMLHVIRSFTDVPVVGDDDERLAVRYRSVLSAKRAILILDDAENEAQVRSLLPPNDGCLVLITSRKVMAALTEAPPPLILSTLDEEDALAMLSAICGKSRIEAEPEASRTLIQQCGALPLALRIVAARLRVRPHWSVAALVTRLSDERRRLDELKVADLEVRACIALSYTDLPESCAKPFRRLSAIPGRDFGPETAGAATGSASAAAQVVLEQLADFQLLEAQSATRYRYHDLIRLFAAERFRDEESVTEQKAVLRRILTAYTVQLDAAADAMNVSSLVGARALPQAPAGNWPVAIPFRNWEVEASRWLQLERVNLIAAIYAAEKFDSVITWKLAQALLPYLENRSSSAELHAVLKVAERAASRLDDPDPAMAVLYYRGRVARLSGKPTEAIGALRDSAQYFLAAGKNAEASEILLTLGQTYRENRLPGDGADALATAFQIRFASHDRAGAAGVLIEIAVIVKEQGRYEDAAHILQFAISLITEDPGTAQSQVRLAWAHENLGATLKHLSRADEAAIHHRASLAVFTELGHLRGQAYAVRNLGDLALRAGALQEAREKYTRSLLLFNELGDRRGGAQALAHLGMVQLRTGQWLRGVGALTQAAFLARRAQSLKTLLRQLRSANPKENPEAPEASDDPQLTRLIQLIESARKIDP